MGTWAFGGGSTGGSSGSVTDGSSPGPYVSSSLAVPGGRINLDGNYPVLITAISPYLASNVRTATIVGQSVGQIYNSNGGGTSTVIIYGNPGTLGFRVAGSGGSQTYFSNGSPAASYSGALVGTFSWSLVNTAPASISVTKTGLSATVTVGVAGGSDADSPSSYIVEYSKNGAGWSNATTANGSRQVTYTGLTPGASYVFRAFAVNNVGYSDAVTSSSVLITAWGRRWTGTTWADNVYGKRWNGSAWVDLVSAKRWNGSAWVDLS